MTLTQAQDDSFAERVSRLQQELELAIRWHRPAILLVVYSSALVWVEVSNTLGAWVETQGHRVVRVSVTTPDAREADLPLRLSTWPDRERTVFFVSGLARGAPTTWNSLNIRREYFVKERLRVVFGLTEYEAAQLPLRAPDFWVFRHRVVEFLEPPRPDDQALRKVAELITQEPTERLSSEERRARIAFREQLLAELPLDDSTASVRARLHYTLAGLYHSDGQYDRAVEHYQAAIPLAEKDTALLSRVYIGLGNVLVDRGQYEEARAAYRQATDINPEDVASWQAWALLELQAGNLKRARELFAQAAKVAPHDASTWLVWALLEQQAGNIERV